MNELAAEDSESEGRSVRNIEKCQRTHASACNVRQAVRKNLSYEVNRSQLFHSCFVDLSVRAFESLVFVHILNVEADVKKNRKERQ